MTRLTRRSFLAGSAAAVAAPAFAAPASAIHAETVIVGAGAAGIAAARRLMAAGREVLLLEASDRIGGRCVTDTRRFGIPLDLGAHWIYSPDVNPLAKLAPRAGLDIYPAPAGQRLRIGQRNGREGEQEDFLDALVRSNRAIADAARKADVDCAHALPHTLGEWRPSVEFALGAYGCGKELRDVSAVDFARSAPRDTSAFCRQGYGALLAKLAGGIPVRLSTPVRRIETWGRGRVDIQTSKGELGARYVIVTASTDVLAAGKIAFEPEPTRQLEAARKLKLGSYDRIALQLNRNPLGLQRDDLVFEKAESARTAAMLANVSGTPLAHVDVGGTLARELSAQGERAMVDFAVEWLAGLYGAGIRKSVGRTFATRWNAEPFILGSVASAAPGGQGARKALMETQRDRVFFAGEATHETQWGTVNGAWESGDRAAEGILRLMGLIKGPAEPKKAPARKPRRRRR